MVRKLDEAIQFAIKAHDGQTRDDRFTPYIVHPFSVLGNLVGIAKVRDEDLACVAMLHDTIEDGPEWVAEEMERQFGTKITSIVLELTLSDGHTREEKTAHIVDLVQNGTPEAVLVKFCDRLDNLEDRSSWKGERSRMYEVQTRQMLEAFWDRYPEMPAQIGCPASDVAARVSKLV